MPLSQRGQGRQLRKAAFLACCQWVEPLTPGKDRGASWYMVHTAKSIDPIAPSQAVHGFDWHLATVHKRSVAKPSVIRLWLHGIQPPMHKREAQINIETWDASYRHGGIARL